MEKGKENKVPAIYSYQGKQYQFNDLQRDADLGISDYIQSLKRGDKDQEEFWNAYSNIMSGIGDGSITFNNGRFSDSLSRYSNGVYYDENGNKQTTNKKSKDYYGLIANYIAGKLGKSQEYQSPEDKSKIKWKGNTSLGLSFNRKMFNSDRGNIQDFIDLDPYDEGTQSRTTANRIKQTKQVVQDIYDNFDNLFSDYSDQDKQQAQKYLQDVLQSLDDNTIDSQDYLPFVRAFSDLGWRKMFSTSNYDEQSDQEGQNQSRDQQRNQNNSKEYTLDYQDKLGEWTASRYLSMLDQQPDDKLYAYLAAAIDNPEIDFSNTSDFSNALGLNGRTVPVSSQWVSRKIIQILKNRGKLVQDAQNSSIFYLPAPFIDSNTNSGFYYDSNNKTLYKKSINDIPYWQDQLQKWYSGDTSEPQTGKYFTTVQYKKNGGIIKARGGTQLWYSGLSAAGDYDPAKYQYSYDTSRLVDADMSDDKWNPWVSDIAGLGVGRYKPTAGNTRAYTQSIENTQYYKNFGNALLNPDGTFTDVGLAWAKAVDAQLPKGSKATFFDESGNLRTTWAPTTNDTYGRTKRQFNNLADYVNYVRNDQILGSRHNVFLNQGNRYFYKDQNGVEHWVDPNEISKYEVSANPVRSQWNDDNTIYWNDYELTGLKPDQVVPDDQEEVPVDDQRNTGSRIYPIGTQSKNSEFAGSGFGDFMLGITPDLIGAGRLFASLRTNNRVARTLDRSLRPVLKDTYERYSPITGAFGEMSFRNRQAADLRRQASRPFTSDASLQLAGQLEADRQARDLEYQGFLADDKEIKRTQEAALARQEDNMARRSEVSNFNRASINQTNREKAQLEATRLRHNWQSVDNFLQGIESRARYNQSERKNALQQVAQSQLQNQYQKSISDLNSLYKSKNPNATSTDMLNDDRYIQGVRDLQGWLKYNLNQSILRPYSINTSSATPKSPEQILRSISFKRGGTLKPSTLYLINKVINNESYT